MSVWVFADSLGSRLAIARKYLRLSQGTVAAFLGTTRQTVAEWELNRNTPRVDHLIGLVNLLRHTPDELMGLEPWSGPTRARKRDVENA